MVYDPKKDISNLGTTLRGDETWPAQQGAVEVNLTPELIKTYVGGGGGGGGDGVTEEEMNAAILIETNARIAVDEELAEAIETVETTVAGYADSIEDLQTDVGALQTVVDGLTIGSDVQAYSAILEALAGLNATGGLLIQTGATSFTKRTITGTANEIAVTNGDGVAGNPTLALPATIALAGKTVTGLNASSIVFTPTGGLAADDVAEALAELDSEKAALAGAVFTGAVEVPAGAVGTPGLRIGDSDTGFFQVAGKLSTAIDGVERVRAGTSGIALGAYDATEAVHIQRTGSAASRMLLEGESGGVNHITLKFSNDAASSNLQFRKGRGTIAVPLAAAQNDIVGLIGFYITDPTAGSGPLWTGRQTAGIYSQVIAAVPSATDSEGRVIVQLTPAASTSAAEFMRWDWATGISMNGANPVIDAARHFRLRSYTISTLPSASVAGQMIQVSDLGGGAGLLVSDGTGWLRARHGQQTVTSDADYTLTPLASAEEQKHTGTLTANRAVTLATTNGRPGNKFRISRTGTGNFVLNVGSGLAYLTTNSWCEVTYDGAAWYLSGFGTIGRNVITKTGDYTAILNDINSIIQMDITTTANTFTVPLNSSVPFPIGTELFVVQIGTGVTTIAATVGVTLNKPDTLALRKRWSGVTLVKVGADTWNCHGDFA